MVETTEPHPDPSEEAPRPSDDLIWARQIVERGASIVLDNVWDAARSLAKLKEADYASDRVVEYLAEAEEQVSKVYEEDLLWTVSELERIITSNPGMITDATGRIVVGVELTHEDGRQRLHFSFEELSS